MALGPTLREHALNDKWQGSLWNVLSVGESLSSWEHETSVTSQLSVFDLPSIQLPFPGLAKSESLWPPELHDWKHGR